MTARQRAEARYRLACEAVTRTKPGQGLRRAVERARQAATELLKREVRGRKR